MNYSCEFSDDPDHKIVCNKLGCIRPAVAHIVDYSSSESWILDACEKHAFALVNTYPERFSVQLFEVYCLDKDE